MSLYDHVCCTNSDVIFNFINDFIIKNEDVSAEVITDFNGGVNGNITMPFDLFYKSVHPFTINQTDENKKFKIRKVIFNSPATIVFWKDGTKTIVKCVDEDTFSPEVGLAMCVVKKLYGNNFKKIFKMFTDDCTEHSECVARFEDGSSWSYKEIRVFDR